MLVHADEPEVNPPHYAEPVDKSPTLRRPDPKHILFRYPDGYPVRMDWPGWDAVAAFMMRDGMACLRDGDLVVLYAVHWSAQTGGRA